MDGFQNLPTHKKLTISRMWIGMNKASYKYLLCHRLHQHLANLQASEMNNNISITSMDIIVWSRLHEVIWTYFCFTQPVPVFMISTCSSTDFIAQLSILVWKYNSIDIIHWVSGPTWPHWILPSESNIWYNQVPAMTRNNISSVKMIFHYFVPFLLFFPPLTQNSR